MINEEMKQKLLENAKEHILDEDLHKVDNLFKKVWKTTEEGIEVITLSPLHENGARCMKFDADTLEWLGIDELDYIEEYGERL